MRKYISLFFSVTIVLSACKGDNAKDQIIPHAQMVSLLTEIHIIDGGIYNTVSQNADTLYKLGTGKYLNLFKKHHVDSVQFRRSLKYYTTKPTELGAMYDEILDGLRQKTDSINKTLFKKNNAQRPI